MNNANDTSNSLGLNKIKNFSLGGIALFLIILIQLRNNRFLSWENINDLLTNTSILAILTIGMMIVLVSGGIDLSIGSSLALSGMTVALTVSRHANISPISTILLGILIGTLCGTFNGFIITYGKVLPIITTLGTLSIYRGVTFVISKGAWVSAHQMSSSFKAIATGKMFGINNLILLGMSVLIIAYYFLFHTRTGRRIYAVGNNKESARVSGINVNSIILMVYVIMGGLAGLAGVLWVSKFASAQGDTANAYEFKVIAACVLGGVSISGGIGRMFDVIMGVIIIGILDNALPLINVSPFLQYLLQGMVILISVIANVVIRRKIDYEALKRRLF